MVQPVTYRAFVYLRLSKEDGDKLESDSISNQRKLVSRYLEQHPELVLVDEIVDDGYSGANFRRPGMQEMLHRLDEGEANCVIVKDMSRFGREYIQSGRYLQRIFPQKGIRFIAINDGYDSLQKQQSDDILIPIKNLMNDSYCRELSNKLRMQFQIQRSNGEFLGAFAAYGYLKSSQNKHKLVVDDYAADVVRGIFHAKMQGYSMQRIAAQLTAQGILSPAAYKRSIGLNYRSGFDGADNGKWNATSVRRILQNRIYVGDLEQGKRYKPNYKTDVVLLRPPEEWCVIPDSHEPVIDLWTFEAVQRDLTCDTRITDKGDMVEPLSGLVICGDCGMNMVQKRVMRGDKPFLYYVCSGHRRKMCCSSHCISKPLLEEQVLGTINTYIGSVLEIQQFMEQADAENLMQVRLHRIDVAIQQKECEIDRDRELCVQLFELKTEGILEQDEYIEMKDSYTQRIRRHQTALEELKQERRELLVQGNRSTLWLRGFKLRFRFEALSRETALTLLQQVKVYENKQISVEFACQDEYLSWKTLMEEMQKGVV